MATGQAGPFEGAVRPLSPSTDDLYSLWQVVDVTAILDQRTFRTLSLQKSHEQADDEELPGRPPHHVNRKD